MAPPHSRSRGSSSGSEPSLQQAQWELLRPAACAASCLAPPDPRAGGHVEVGTFRGSGNLFGGQFFGATCAADLSEHDEEEDIFGDLPSLPLLNDTMLGNSRAHGQQQCTPLMTRQTQCAPSGIPSACPGTAAPTGLQVKGVVKLEPHPIPALLRSASGHPQPEQPGPQPSQGTDPVNEKKARRLQCNRASAKRCRQRKLDRLQELEALTEKLLEQQAELDQRMHQSEAELQRHEDENAALREQVHALRGQWQRQSTLDSSFPSAGEEHSTPSLLSGQGVAPEGEEDVPPRKRGKAEEEQLALSNLADFFVSLESHSSDLQLLQGL